MVTALVGRHLAASGQLLATVVVPADLDSWKHRVAQGSQGPRDGGQRWQTAHPVESSSSSRASDRTSSSGRFGLTREAARSIAA